MCMSMRAEAKTWVTPLPRERGLVDGFESLGDAELVAVLLGTGEKGCPVAHMAAILLDELGGLPGLRRAGVHALADRRGIGMAKAARLAAALELGQRALMREVLAPRLASSEEVARWGRLRLSTLDHEQIWVLALDGRNNLRAAKRVAEGGLHGCSIDPARCSSGGGPRGRERVRSRPQSSERRSDAEP